MDNLGVLCMGDLCIDELIVCKDYPPAGGEVEVAESLRSPGGSAANCAAVLAGLGVKVGLIARYGADGEWLRQRLQSLGVDTTGLQRDDSEPTGIVRVVVARGERTMFCQRGANAHLNLAKLADYLSGVGILHISGYTLMEEKPRQAAVSAIQAARELGVKVSVDPGVAAAHNEAARKTLLSLLNKVDILFPNEMELDVIARGCGVDFFLEQGVQEVVVTEGERGARFQSEKASLQVPAFAVEVVNTTGAGDAFAAGYLAGVVHALPAQERLLLGSLCGALAVSTEGGPFELARQGINRDKLLSAVKNGAAGVEQFLAETGGLRTG